MALLSWNDSYSVGVKTIDQQHSTLFSMLNELHGAMMKGRAQAVTGPILQKLVKYTEEHFAYEERAMEVAKYPGYAAHRAHHNDLAGRVKEFMSRYERGDANVNIELLGFISNWLKKHIQHEDKEYGPWLRQHGAH